MRASGEHVTPGIKLTGLDSRALELRDLRCFHSVAHTGNLGHAARALNISQPSVTRQVKKLEDEIGTLLLIRHGRGVTLTQAGTRLMDRLDVIMRLLNAPLEPAPMPERNADTISLALPPEVAPLLIPRLLEQCRTRWPGVRLAVREGASASLEEWVLDRRVDIAVLQDPPVLAELDLDPVVTERLGLVSGVRMGSWNTGGPVRVRDLAGRALILPQPRHWIRRLVESAAFRRGIALDRVQQADGIALTRQMVRDGLGQTILPYAAVADEIARGSLAFQPIAHDPLEAVHAIACRTEVAAIPFIADFRRLLRGVMAGLVTTGGWPGAALTVPAPSRVGLGSHSAMEIAAE